ncbi:hypothetical protein [Modicisalibacter tunisiensis]|uniref:Uncharacterized protein n=1 Tax=Modicisalibacter tunisiensis TaxID=390637 RepID=A0ABS7X0T6_9GAMM|nr:hypothetical protein [Modicisalibacter tunisiensis]MBZ9568504.1 hypothetical protein [Modicisalibacter tunisiensis]
MRTITRDSLAQAAQEGTGIAHLSPGQAWAAHHLAMPPERLEKPLAPHITELLESVERLAQRRFFGDVAPGDAEAMIHRAHDEDHPMFLRLPILETLREGMSEHFPDLKPAGYDDQGNPVYSLADLAEALGASEEDLLAHAEEAGFADQLRTTPPKPLH